MATAAKLPSLSRQKEFIVDNAALLNRDIKIAILSLVIMEVGMEAVLENTAAAEKEVNVDLDVVEVNNPELIPQIYNMVAARLSILNQPARPGDA